MSESFLERYRTGWDIVFGVLLVIGGFVILAHAAIATTVSVLFVGWMLLITGLVGLVGSFFRIGKGGFWSAALGGTLLAVLGLAFLRNTGVAAVTFTLLAGMVFLISGVVRLVVSAQEPEYRVPLIVAGVISAALGLLVLFNLFEASFVLIGVLLGVQCIVDGITMMLIGHWRFVPAQPPSRMATP